MATERINPQLLTPYSTNTFTFSSPPTVTSGTYWLYFHPETTFGGDSYILFDAGSVDYPGGYFGYYEPGFTPVPPPWTIVNGDMIGKILTTSGDIILGSGSAVASGSVSIVGGVAGKAIQTFTVS